jgi:hypothetical protein
MPQKFHHGSMNKQMSRNSLTLGEQSKWKSNVAATQGNETNSKCMVEFQ